MADASEASVKAVALREAAADIRRIRENGLPDGMTSHPVSSTFESWLLRPIQRSEDGTLADGLRRHHQMVHGKPKGVS